MVAVHGMYVSTAAQHHHVKIIIMILITLTLVPALPMTTRGTVRTAGTGFWNGMVPPMLDTAPPNKRQGTGHTVSLPVTATLTMNSGKLNQHVSCEFACPSALP